MTYTQGHATGWKKGKGNGRTTAFNPKRKKSRRGVKPIVRAYGQLAGKKLPEPRGY